MALLPSLICTQRFAGITAVPEVTVILCEVVATPQLKPDAAPLIRRASANPEHDAEVLVAKSVLVAPSPPRFQPTGKVMLMLCVAETPLGVTN